LHQQGAPLDLGVDRPSVYRHGNRGHGHTFVRMSELHSCHREHRVHRDRAGVECESNCDRRQQNQLCSLLSPLSRSDSVPLCSL
jgi:hypothetical protein